MFCPKCGKQIDYETKFCMDCGTELNSADSQQSQPPVLQQELKMGWFKFLIYFSLFASAVLNLISGISFLTGSRYGGKEDAELVYETFEKLKTLDMIMGVLCIILGVLALITRFRLAKFRKDGPLTLAILYIATSIVNIIYIISFVSIIPSFITEQMDFTSTITSIIVGIVMIFVNAIYFKKRKHLFVN